MKQRLDKKSIYTFFISYCYGIFFLVVLFGIIGGMIMVQLKDLVPDWVASIHISGGTWLIVVGVILVWGIIWSVLAYMSYRYELNEFEFRKEHGVIAKRYTSIPYMRIQNVDIRRSLFERILGISHLVIQTAGANSGAEGVLPGLSWETAEELREALSERVRRAKKGKTPDIAIS